MRPTIALGCAAVLALVLWLASPVTQAQRNAGPDFLPDTANPSDGLVVTNRAAGSGVATFARARGAGVAVAAPAASSASVRALAFVTSHGPAFGLRQAADVRLLRETPPDQVGLEHVRFQQVVGTVPVTAGEFVVHLRGARVVAINADLLSDVAVDVSPTLLPAEAIIRARELMDRLLDAAAVAGLQYSEPRLEVFNRGLLQDGSYPTRLAWFVEARALAVRERIWVDARTGGILLHFDQVTSGRNRRVYSADHDSLLPGRLVRTEGGPATGNLDEDSAYDFSGDTYDYFFTQHGRDSYDNAGATLTSSVRYCPNFLFCPYGNAFWNGTQMVYGEGFAAADDVDGHELTHAVTEHSAGLFYYMQSGALNESFSDIFGEAIDLTNGKGNDAASVKWKIGEDLPASVGSIRDMADPTVFGDPGKISDPEFQVDYSTDGGGVHTNSGVPNHAFALMVDGGTYNGRTVTGIGLTAAGKIQYRALTVYLTSGSNFIDNYEALQQSCADLIGISGITSATCVQVKTALDAVEMNGQFAFNFPEPAFCSAGQTPVELFADDFEASPNPGWSTTALVGSGTWVVPDVGWAKSGTRMAWGEGFGTVADSVMSMTSSVPLPAGAKLQFNHAYAFEGDFFAYDGGVIEYSVNGGASWLDAGSLVVAGDRYDPGFPIAEWFGNPLGGRFGFVGNSYGYTASQLDLSSLAGQQVRFRYRVGTDVAVGDIGWVVDDFRLYTCGAGCAFSLSPGSQSFSAEGGTGSVTLTASAASCGWTATSSDPWITVTSAGSGTGGGNVTYSVEANTAGTPRSGTLAIAGQPFTVTQAAAVPLSVTLTAPNGAEKLYTGTPFTIEWTASGAASFDVAASTNGGATYTAVPGCTGLPGSIRHCTWSTPGPLTSNGRVRVTARNAGGATLSDLSDAAFRIVSGTASITLTFPNSAVNVGIGSLQVVKWKHNLGTPSWVRIELSRDGGVTYPELLAAAQQNSGGSAGSFDWRVAGPATTGAQARIRVTWTNGSASDVSDAAFTIAPAFVTVTTPIVNGSWGFNTTQKQTWTTNLGALDVVNVQLSTAGLGGPYVTLGGGANVIATNKQASVAVPNTATTTARVKVVWANAPAGAAAAGNNPGNFKIEAPFVTVATPSAGQLWPIGTAKTIVWKSNLGALENVDIRLSQDGGATYPIVIIGSTPSDGNHPVTVAAAWGSQTTTRIKVTSLDAPTATGTSAIFSIQP